MKRPPRPEPAVAAAEAARLGEELRDARMALGLSIEDVAAALRIRRVYLVALEEGRARDLPAPAYAVGFVRSYAKALGLDDDEVVRRFRDGTSTVVPRRTDLVFPEPVPERGVPAGALVLAGAVVVIGVYVAWWNWSGSGDRIVDTVPPPPPRIEELAAAREPAPPPEPPAVTPPPSSAAAALVPGVVPPQRPGPAPAPAAGGPAPPQAMPAPPQAAPAPPDAPRPADGGRIVLRARGADVWIQVRERVNGPILVDRVLRPGDSYSVPNRETALVLNTGNANGLEIVLDGQPLPGGLGAGPITRRGLVLDPERLRAIPAAAAGQGAAAPQPQATAPAQAPNRGPTQPPGQAPAQIPAPQRPPAQ